MANLRILLNLLWIILGGLIMALGWAFAGVLMAITIIGLPWVPACFRIARFTLWPFGYQAVAREQHIAAEAVGCLGNIIWLILAGWWLALGHLTLAIGYFISIIGIPFGWQHIKMLRISLAPIGMKIEAISEQN